MDKVADYGRHAVELWRCAYSSLWQDVVRHETTINYANACLPCGLSPVLSRSPRIQISGTLDKHRSCMELLGCSWCATWTMMHWTRTVPLPFRLDRMSVRACANTTDNNANKCSKIYKSRQAKWYKMIKNKGIYLYIFILWIYREYSIWL